MLQSYETAWSELQSRLADAEGQTKDLGAALSALRAQQLEAGFIRDRLDHVERFILRHPERPSRFFQLQFNSERAKRFNGYGATNPPPGLAAVNEGCFLCRDNIHWQQDGRQLGYELDAGGRGFFAWMNPFPLLPTHVVIAAKEHRPQDWLSLDSAEMDLDTVPRELVALASRLPGYVGFYNGVEAGASIPSHLHYQFCKRPDDALEFPLEHFARETECKAATTCILGNYPLAVALWRGTPEDVIETASVWLTQWVALNASRLPSLSANFIACYDAEDRSAQGEERADFSLYFIPRDRHKNRSPWFFGVIGGLEALGELVISDPAERDLLKSGAIDYGTLESHLANAHTALFPDRI